MEITDVNIISDFEAGIKYLENPSLLSRLHSVSAIQPYSFWKLGVLIIAIFATFKSLIHVIVLLVPRISAVKSINCSLETLLDDHDVDFSDCESWSSLSESDDENLDSISSDEDREPVDEDFRVLGSSYYSGEEHLNGSKKPQGSPIGSRCFSWSDFTSGNSVVQLWDTIGLGLDFQESVGSEISIWNLDSFYGWGFQIPAVEMSSSPLTLSARTNDSKSIGLNTYDRRITREIPTMQADWSSRLGNVIRISSGGVEKVYVKDGTGSVIVGDLRNIKTTLASLWGYGCK